MSQSLRTEQWLRHASGDGSYGDIIEHLGREHVVVALGAKLCTEPQAQLLLSFAVNLICRLFPIVQHLTIVISRDAELVAHVPRWRAPSLKSHIRTMLKAVGPPMQWAISQHIPPTRTITLAIGSDIRALPSDSIFVGSHGWTAHFSPTAPESVGSSSNPIGAYAASCISVAEIWKRLLMPCRDRFPGTPIVPTNRRLVFSALTYTEVDDEYTPLPPSIDIQRLTIIGSGAGGGATAYALASIHDLSAHINAIDPDTVDSSNLNRYVYADSLDALKKRQKTTIVKELFKRHTHVKVNDYADSFDSTIGRLATSDLRHVLAAVHSREARREIQMETPMILWDCGAAEHGEFRIWRHVLRQTECMWCKHPRNDIDPEIMKARQLDSVFEMGAETWIRKIKNHEPFTSDEVGQMAKYHSAENSTIKLPRVGERYDDWEATQCGKLNLPDVDQSVPMPFAPTMAGVLIAGEIIKEHVAPDFCLTGSYENTLLGSFSEHRKPERRLPNAHCAFCHDNANRRQYERRWLAQ